MNNSIIDLFSVQIFLIGVGIYAIVRAAVKRYRRKHRSPAIADSSVLLSYYTEGVEILPIKKGAVDGMRYSVLATVSKNITARDSDSAVLIAVDLPFRTKIHLVGISKKSGTTALRPDGKSGIMEKVILEGDYHNYFTLYTEKGSQQEARYVLDPKAMVFTIDFCQSHNWEIIRDTLYFLQETGSKSKDDPTHMEQDIVTFIKEIKPAVIDVNTPLQEHIRTPYGEDRREHLKCPICQELLINNVQFYSCPSKHGFLINGKNLTKLLNKEIMIDASTYIKSQKRHEKIKCPSCGMYMKIIAYNGGDPTIDSCSNCPYRWLDYDEISKI